MVYHIQDIVFSTLTTWHWAIIYSSPLLPGVNITFRITFKSCSKFCYSMSWILRIIHRPLMWIDTKITVQWRRRALGNESPAQIIMCAFRTCLKDLIFEGSNFLEVFQLPTSTCWLLLSDRGRSDNTQFMTIF